jgi:uncharacterized protein
LALRPPGESLAHQIESPTVPGDLYRYAGDGTATVAPAVKGEPVAFVPTKGYATVRRTWKAGETLVLDLAMPVRRMLAHRRVADDRGRVGAGGR